MTIASMTGFARSQGQQGESAWAWEVKSVNGRGLEARCRLPPGFEGIEAAARERLARHFRRGNVQMALTLSRLRPRTTIRVNREALDQALALAAEIRTRFPDARRPSADGLLAIRGVVETADEEEDAEARAALETALLAGLDQTLADLAATRDAEGTRLAAVLNEQLAAIERLCDRAAALAALQPEAIRERLHAQVAAILDAAPALPEERLVQEAALLLVKADVREELDRLRAHLAAARDLLAEPGPVGRRLDFLCQEFNREANTLCSKSADVELTRIGLDLKAAIEQLREQVQNIE